MALCDKCEVPCKADKVNDIEDTKANKPVFHYEPMFQLSDPKHEETEYYKLPDSEKYVKEIDVDGRKVLKVDP